MKLTELFKQARDTAMTRRGPMPVAKTNIFAKGMTNAPRAEIATRQQRNVPVVRTTPMQAGDQAIPSLFHKDPQTATLAMTAQTVQNIGPGKTIKPAPASPTTAPVNPKLTAQAIHKQFGGTVLPSPAGTGTNRQRVKMEEMKAKLEEIKSREPMHTKATELPPPPMTTLPKDTSAMPTANTAETAKANIGYNPLHEAPKNATKIQKLREFLGKHPYGTGAAALAIMAAGTAVLAKAPHKTTQQRRIEERAKFANSIDNKNPINISMLYQGGLEVPQIRNAYKEYLESGAHKRTTFKDYLQSIILTGGVTAAVTRFAGKKTFSPMLTAGLIGGGVGAGIEGIQHYQRNKENKLMDKYRAGTQKQKDRIIDKQMFDQLKWIS